MQRTSTTGPVPPRERAPQPSRLAWRCRRCSGPRPRVAVQAPTTNATALLLRADSPHSRLLTGCWPTGDLVEGLGVRVDHGEKGAIRATLPTRPVGKGDRGLRTVDSRQGLVTRMCFRRSRLESGTPGGYPLRRAYRDSEVPDPASQPATGRCPEPRAVMRRSSRSYKLMP